MNCDVAIKMGYQFFGLPFSGDFFEEVDSLVAKSPKLDLFVQRREDRLMYYAWRFKHSDESWSTVYMCCNGVYLPYDSAMAVLDKLRWLEGKADSRLKNAEILFRNGDIACEPLPPLDYGSTLQNKFSNTLNPDGVSLYAKHNARLVAATSSEDQSFTVNGVRFNMIRVEGGTFRMGATEEQGSDAWDYEKPVHSVTLSDYYIGQTEVTQELWRAVMGSNPSYFKGDSQCPVESVSWEDCQEFIEKLNRLTGRTFRLPTEAEWEFAARGGNKSRGYKYSGSNTASDVAWYSGNSGSRTHVVASKRANELGLYDMSGNVWEWCSDWYGAYGSSSKRNPNGPSSGGNRVLRGGSRYHSARNVRVSDRSRYTPSYRNNYYGLRLAL